MRISIFLFHRVNDSKDPLWPPMTTKRFQEVTRYIAKNHTVIGLDELYEAINGKAIKTNKPLASISFDDGFKDNIEYAAPILSKQGLTATYYVVTSCMDQGRATWTYLLDQLLLGTKMKNIRLDRITDTNLQSAKLQSISNKAKYSFQLKHHLKSADEKYRSEVMEEIKSTLLDVNQENPMMDWKDIRQLISEGFTIGSHTVNHPPLATLEDEERIRFELAFSRQRITDETGITPIAIAYPVGSFDQRTTRLSEEAGYLMGMAVEQRVSNLNEDNMFALPRLELYQENRLKTWLRMKGMQQRIKNMIHS